MGREVRLGRERRTSGYIAKIESLLAKGGRLIPARDWQAIPGLDKSLAKQRPPFAVNRMSRIGPPRGLQHPGEGNEDSRKKVQRGRERNTMAMWKVNHIFDHVVTVTAQRGNELEKGSPAGTCRCHDPQFAEVDDHGPVVDAGSASTIHSTIVPQAYCGTPRVQNRGHKGGGRYMGGVLYVVGMFGLDVS